MPLLASASLVACGGGGGSSPATGLQWLRLSRSAVDISQPVNQVVAPEETVGITLENPQSSSYFIRARATANGLRQVQDIRTATGIELAVRFKAPVDLPPGVYDDTVTFEVCTDVSCSSLVPNVTATLAVRYTITAVSLAATLGASSIDVQAFLTDPTLLSEELDVTLDGAAGMPFVVTTWAGSAVTHATTFSLDNRNFTLRYNLENPAVLGAGEFDSTITITACLDQNCVNPFPQSPLTVPVRLTVTDSASGPNGYNVRIVQARGVAMAWDAVRQRFYISAPDPTGADLVHNVLELDPVTWQVSASVPVTARPSSLAIADNGEFLYVAPAYADGPLERLRLPSLQADLSVPLLDSAGRACTPTDLATAPLQPTVVALGCRLVLLGAETTAVMVYDGALLRGTVDGVVPTSGLDANTHAVAWAADASRLFAASFRSPQLYDISVGAGGLSLAATAPAQARGGLRLANGLLYSDNGSIFDPDSLTQVGALVPRRDGANGEALRVLVDVPNNRIFAIARFLDLPPIHFRPPMSLVSFDLAQRTQIASMPLDPTLIYGDLVRFGDDGLAFFGGGLIVVNGPFVAP